MIKKGTTVYILIYYKTIEKLQLIIFFYFTAPPPLLAVALMWCLTLSNVMHNEESRITFAMLIFFRVFIDDGVTVITCI